MTRTKNFEPDPVLDLVFERVVDVPRELVWKAWTTPAHIKKWFTPAPWTTIDCEIDLRPGGIFRTVMRSPEGQEFPNVGCYLEIVPNERLAWTNALLPGFRPAIGNPACPGEVFSFTAVISLEPARKRDPVHGPRRPWRRRGTQEARGDGLPRRLGQGARSAGRARQEIADGRRLIFSLPRGASPCNPFADAN